MTQQIPAGKPTATVPSQHCPSDSDPLKMAEGMSRLARRLQRRLIREGLPLPPFRIARTYAGRYQRTLGAWSWDARRLDNNYPIDIPGLGQCLLGSEWPATECATADELAVEYIDGAVHLTVERP